MKLCKLGAIFMAATLINGCVVYDSVQAVRDVIELSDKKDQMLITKEKAKFIDGVKVINVVFVTKDLDTSEERLNPLYGKMFCRYYNDSSLLKKLSQSGAIVPKCVTDTESKGDLQLYIQQSIHQEFGFWSQSKYEASFKSITDGNVLHSIDRDRDTLPDFSEVVIGLTGTIIDVNRS
ncbi:hypothetical protein [Pseudoalteromonas xiamenensis]